MSRNGQVVPLGVGMCGRNGDAGAGLMQRKLSARFRCKWWRDVIGWWEWEDKAGDKAEDKAGNPRKSLPG